MYSIYKSVLPVALNIRVSDMLATNKTKLTPDLNWVRQELREGSAFRKSLEPDWQTNLFTGLPWHEEDSPGNFTLRQGSDGVEYSLVRH